MEITNESEFKARLKRLMELAGAHVTNIESYTKNGIPDTYVCINHKAFWMELKCDDRTKALIRKEQRVWGYKHSRAGGISVVVHYNRKTEICTIWSNPIHEIRPVGKYLEIQDFPIARTEISDVLFKVLLLC